MTLETDRFQAAKEVADAVLYEGYLLYPYRASSNKNQVRWQFGVLAPKGYSLESSENWAMQTECLIERGDAALVDIRVRFLQVQQRLVEELVAAGDYQPVSALEVDGLPLLPWDEGVEREIDLGTFAVAALVGAERVLPLAIPGGTDEEPVVDSEGELRGRIVRRRHPLEGSVTLTAEGLDVDRGLIRLRVGIANQSPWNTPGGSRDAALMRSLVAAHTLLGLEGGAFLSLADPPGWAKGAADGCDNRHTWPVLLGEPGSSDVVLSSPIILGDHPAIAPESKGDFFDSTEIDELLALRVMTLTDEEKREARATDAKAAAIIDRCDIMPPEIMSRLHGAVRSLESSASAPARREDSWAGAGEGGASFTSEWEAFLNEGAAAPEVERVRIGAVEVSKGSRVQLRPLRRADAQDLFLSGRSAIVQAVLRDVDGDTHVAVTLEDDPARDLHEWYGRFLYFSPDEIEPLDDDDGRREASK